MDTVFSLWYFALQISWENNDWHLTKRPKRECLTLLSSPFRYKCLSLTWHTTNIFVRWSIWVKIKGLGEQSWTRHRSCGYNDNMDGRLRARPSISFVRTCDSMVRWSGFLLFGVDSFGQRPIYFLSIAMSITSLASALRRKYHLDIMWSNLNGL